MARGGQVEAFGGLVMRHQRRAMRVAYGLLGNLHDALEICQDAFVRAYRNISTLADVTRFEPWLLRIITNLSLNRRRSRRNQAAPAAEAAWDALAEKRGGPSACVPGARLAAAELAERIRQSLKELPDRQRAALVLYSVERLPQREVAQLLDCSVEAVKWHVFEARRKLRAVLADYF
jgi:RNA polymerase sigma-70 factor (ECF subfamily)